MCQIRHNFAKILLHFDSNIAAIRQIHPGLCQDQGMLSIMLYIVLALLYLGQLVYIGNRWVLETADIIEKNRMARLRRAIDWTQEPDKRRRLRR